MKHSSPAGTDVVVGTGATSVAYAGPVPRLPVRPSIGETWYRLAAMLDDTAQPLTDAPRGPLRLYPKLLGAAWQALDPAVQRVHTDASLTHAEGTFQVSRAPGSLLGRIFDVAHVPRASNAAQVRLAVSHRGLVERWQREFGGRPLVTVQSEAPGGLLAERTGVLEFRSRLTVKNGALLFRHTGLAICLGPLRVPLPDWLSIKVGGREGPADAGGDSRPHTTVEVRVTGPTGGLLFAYRGTVRWCSGDSVG